MRQSIILGIHGLLNKPPRTVLTDWWANAIAEGLHRNQGVIKRPAFELAYWADIRNPNPITLEELDERYEKVKGQGALKRYDPGVTDKARAIAQKWGGRLLDKEKELFGLGANVERLLDIKFDDLSDYYETEDIRNQIRTKLYDVLMHHRDRRVLLLAHSMGSIIAYDVLRTLDNTESLQIEHMITIGSPLGLPIVAHNIREEFGATCTPHNVRRWTNIADPGDKVALDCDLADEYEPHNGVRVVDILVHNDYVNHEGNANNHKSYGYLRAPEVSDSIQEFLSADG